MNIPKLDLGIVVTLFIGALTWATAKQLWDLVTVDEDEKEQKSE